METVQTHYADTLSDNDVVMESFLALSANEDANTINCKHCTKCPNKEKESKSLKKVTMPSPKPSSGTRTFLKIAKNQRK